MSDETTMHFLSPAGRIVRRDLDSDMTAPEIHAENTDLHHDDTSDIVKSLKQPTAEGAIENRPHFKKALEEMYNSMGNGRVRGEAGFFVDKDGSTTKLQKSTNRNDGSGHLELNLPAGTSPRIAVHSHADSSSDRPSPQDIQSAKDKKMTIHVLSKSGLWAVDPSGKVTRPYDSTADAFSRKKMVKPEHEFSNAPYSLAASARKAK